MSGLNQLKSKLRRFILPVLIFVFVIQCIGIPVFAENSDDSEDEIENMVTETLNRSGASKISVGTFKDNDVRYYGQENKDLKYQVGQVSKEFISLGVLKLIEAGYIALEDSVSDYIKDFNPSYKGNPCVVTIENLLTQSSGIDDSKMKYTDTDELKNLPYYINQSLIFEPGYNVSQSECNYAIMALIIENISGKSYKEYIKSEVLDSLALNDTFEYKPKGENTVSGNRLGYGRTIKYSLGYSELKQPSCYMYSSIKDMINWMRELSGDVYFDDSMTTVLSQYKILIDLNEECTAWNYDDNKYVIKSNLPNYSSAIIMDTRNNTGVCVLADCNIGNTVENLAQRIYESINGLEVENCTLDIMIKLDMAFIVITVLVFGVTIYFIIKTASRKSKKESTYILTHEIILVVLTIGLGILLPIELKMNWYDLLMTWAPFSVVVGMILLVLSCVAGLICTVILND